MDKYEQTDVLSVKKNYLSATAKTDNSFVDKYEQTDVLSVKKNYLSATAKTLSP